MPSEEELMSQGEAINCANPERQGQVRRMFDAIPKREYGPRDLVTSENPARAPGHDSPLKFSNDLFRMLEHERRNILAIHLTTDLLESVKTLMRPNVRPGAITENRLYGMLIKTDDTLPAPGWRVEFKASQTGLPLPGSFIGIDQVVEFCLAKPKRIVIVADYSYARLAIMRAKLKEQAMENLWQPCSGHLVFHNKSCVWFMYENNLDMAQGMEISAFSGNPSEGMRDLLQLRCRKQDEE